MQSTQQQPDPHPLELCLLQMDALAEEITQAMRAIEGNHLPLIEGSIRAQQQGSVKLKAAFAHATLAPEPVGQPRLQVKLRQSAQRLYLLNEQYAALLEHSGRSLHLLRMLYGQAGTAFPQQQPAPPQRALSWQG